MEHKNFKEFFEKISPRLGVRKISFTKIFN